VNLDASYAIAIYNRGNAYFAKGETERWRLPIPTAASNGAPRASSPAPSPTTMRRSKPTRKHQRAIADYDEAITSMCSLISA
jgi:hypothetical protein